MGCPGNAELLIGIVVSWEKATELKEFIKSYPFESNEQWMKDIGPYAEISSPSYGEGDCFVELESIERVDNCSHVREVDITNLPELMEEAINRFNSSSFLQQHFKQSDIRVLITCDID